MWTHDSCGEVPGAGGGGKTMKEPRKSGHGDRIARYLDWWQLHNHVHWLKPTGPSTKRGKFYINNPSINLPLMRVVGIVSSRGRDRVYLARHEAQRTAERESAFSPLPCTDICIPSRNDPSHPGLEGVATKSQGTEQKRCLICGALAPSCSGNKNNLHPHVVLAGEGRWSLGLFSPAAGTQD